MQLSKFSTLFLLRRRNLSKCEEHQSTRPGSQKEQKETRAGQQHPPLCFLTASTGETQLLFLLPCSPCYSEWHPQTANKTSLSSVSHFCQSSKVNMLGGHSTDCHFYEVYLLINPTCSRNQKNRTESEHKVGLCDTTLYSMLDNECKLNTYNMHILLQINYASIKQQDLCICVHYRRELQLNVHFW